MFRIVLCGNAAVGKTCLLGSLTGRPFLDEVPPTVGAAYGIWDTTIEGRRIKLQIWDTGGSEQYAALAPVYFRGADGALIVWDVADAESFKALPRWMDQFRNVLGNEGIIVLVGNKVDLLRADNDPFPREEGQRFADQQAVPLIFTSARKGEGVVAAFTTMAQRLAVKLPLARVPHEQIAVVEEIEPRPRRGCGC